MELINSQVNLGQDLFILEKSGTHMTVENKKEYVLEGIAAVFGEENNNGRIYEEAEYMPHLEYLQEKIAKKRLLGELDHPEKFDVSLKNISHIVESLEYDKSSRQIKIRVRLVDTPAGRIAMALVDAGVPLSISSRAAGSVMENKRVKIKKIFTFDLVADPGFEKAQLERVYESVNFNYDEKETILKKLSEVETGISNLKIYRIDEHESVAFQKAIEGEKTKPSNDMSKYVTVDEMNDYSAIFKAKVDDLVSEIQSLKEGLNNPDTNRSDDKLEKRLSKLEGYTKYLAENLDKNIQYSEYLAETLDKDIEYTKYLAENLDRNISFSDYLAENLEKNIRYSEYLAENLDKNISYSEYLAENLDRNISYSEYLAENLDRNISYSEYLAENLDKNISYSEYLAENVDKNISYSEYLAENLDKNITYSEYLAENLDKGIGYSEYLAEKIERNIAYSEYIAENVNVGYSKADSISESNTQTINENKKSVVDFSQLPKSIDALLESAKNQKAAGILNETKYPFFKFINDEKRAEFMSLDEAKKEKVANALKDGVYFKEADVLTKWENALVEHETAKQEPLFIQLMPENVKPIWESLSVEEKERTYAASKLRKLETPYQVKSFWNSRTFVKGEAVGLVKLNENQTAVTKVKPSTSGISNDYMAGIAEELGKRFRK
jgi:hypothetical protein